MLRMNEKFVTQQNPLKFSVAPVSNNTSDFVGIASLSEVEGGQAHRHGVEAPRDFESRPNHQAISHHFLNSYKSST